MKTFRNILLVTITLLIFNPQQVNAQTKFYTESSGEVIFSFADIEYNNQSVSTLPRFSMFFHTGNNLHYNFSSFAGIYSGWALRNIGFITEENSIKMKRRTYSIGIPIALKIGNMAEKVFVYGGGSYEMFFHYKQKQFIDGNKSKQKEWFSDRTERFAPSFFAGIQFPKGINLKFKYYPNDFLNRDFVGEDFGESVVYADYAKTNLFYFSISFNIDTKTMGMKTKDNDMVKYTSFQ